MHVSAPGEEMRMESNVNLSPSSSLAQSATHGTAELVVQNGRLRGARRSLAHALTLIGRDESCNLRLNVDDVSPQHCVLVPTASGWIVGDLHSTTGTLLNGSSIVCQTLRDGDVLTIGRFHFLFQFTPVLTVPPDSPAPTAALVPSPRADDRGDQEAMRIPIAALAAQQIILFEEENKLQQRRLSLEQQEKQLATHLEEKRRRLVDLRAQASAARLELKKERRDYEKRVEDMNRDLACARHEIVEGRQLALKDRQRLLELRKRLKQRWHRSWAAERAALRRQQDDLLHARHRLESEQERLQQEKAALHLARRQFNGDAELGRRELQVERDRLNQERQLGEVQRRRAAEDLHERSAQLDIRARSLAEAEGGRAAAERQAEEKRLALEAEHAGLERRIRNQRAKVFEQEQEIARLQSTYRNSQPIEHNRDTVEGHAVIAPATEEVDGVVAADRIRREKVLRDAEQELQQRTDVLQTLAGELADQRWHLAEQFSRLAQARDRWEKERIAAVQELDGLAARLQQREQALAAGEESLLFSKEKLNCRAEGMEQQQQHLAAWQARLVLRSTLWEGEYQRRLTELAAREELVEKRFVQMEQLRQKGRKRRQQLLERLRAVRSHWESLHEQATLLRELSVQREILLTREKRSLAERALALEEYRRKYLRKAKNQAAAEKRLERLRQRWSALSASAERKLQLQRKTLQTEAARVQDQLRQFHQLLENLAAQEMELSQRQGEWEQTQALRESHDAQSQRDIQRLRDQRQGYELQLQTLREELERVALVLLGESTAEPPAASAA